MFKISLPNPSDYNVPEFLKQMRIVLKCAELSYEEMVKELELNENNTPYINYRQSQLKRALVEDFNEKDDAQKIQDAPDLDDYYEQQQTIELEINMP